MEKEHKQEGMSTQNKVLLGAGIAALAAAAAGAIFLYGTEKGKQTRKQIRSWALKMKADVLDEMEKMKEWSEEAYNAVVDSVAQKYEAMKTIDPIEIAALARDLKKHWQAIHDSVTGKKTPRTRRSRTTKQK